MARHVGRPTVTAVLTVISSQPNHYEHGGRETSCQRRETKKEGEISVSARMLQQRKIREIRGHSRKIKITSVKVGLSLILKLRERMSCSTSLLV